ncbi:MAG: hypothetical protein D6732_05585 [Methanobacteriota archaeon]|nr:MAG: hypothetical protein D6732_05585 [Euryarchaeota archaeon]
MHMKITSPWVKRGIKSLGEEDFETIRKFYRKYFHPDPKMDFKFRSLKGFFYDANRDTFYWRSLHNLFNKRIFDHGKLQFLIPKGIEKGYYPIRLFQSSTRWLDPRSMGKKTDFRQIMIGNGMAVLESDTSLEESISVALKCNDLLQEEKKRFIFTGNKSIHIWVVEFDPKKWVGRDCILDLECHLKARKVFFDSIQEKIAVKLDPQTTIDIQRLVPIVGSLNGFTGRVVTELSIGDIKQFDAQQIRLLTTFSP